MANRWFQQFYGTMHKKPVTLDCNFVVAPTSTDGKGITSLKGPGIASVFMNSTASVTGDTHTNTVIDGIASTANLRVGMRISGTGIAAGTTIATITSATAITTSLATTGTATVAITYGAVGSFNPAAGNILVKFQDNYPQYYFGGAQMQAPLSGTPVAVGSTALTPGVAYVITVVGTTTAAEWAAVGVPVGTTPAVGVVFIAALTGSGAGTGSVQVAAASNAPLVQVVGVPNLTMTSTGATKVDGSGSGSYMILQNMAATNSSTTTLIATAPAAGTIVRLSFFLNNSMILQQGE